MASVRYNPCDLGSNSITCCDARGSKSQDSQSSQHKGSLYLSENPHADLPGERLHQPSKTSIDQVAHDIPRESVVLSVVQLISQYLA